MAYPLWFSCSGGAAAGPNKMRANVIGSAPIRGTAQSDLEQAAEWIRATEGSNGEGSRQTVFISVTNNEPNRTWVMLSPLQDTILESTCAVISNVFLIPDDRYTIGIPSYSDELDMVILHLLRLKAPKAEELAADLMRNGDGAKATT